MMKTFNLYGDDWHETRDREGWRIKEAFVGNHIGGGTQRDKVVRGSLSVAGHLLLLTIAEHFASV